MLGSLKESLDRATKEKISCLYLSGGSDSLLLLYALLDIKAEFSIVTFDMTFSREQKQVIDDLVYEENLRVFSYKPAAAYFIGNDNKMAFIEEYRLRDGSLIPFIRDCVGGEKCSFDVMVETRPDVPVGFDVNIVGTRRTDRHWSLGKLMRKPEFGSIIAPLWDWTRADVAGALKEYGLEKPKVDTGNYQFCTRCLEGKGQVYCPKQKKEIDAVSWDAPAMLGAFQTKFKGEETYK